LAGDVSFFAPHQSGSGGVDIYVLPFTPLLMARLPLLTSDELPNGRLQPYAAIGPGIFTTVVYEDSTDYTAAGVDVGLDVRAGLNVQILKWLGVFAEYRYTSYEADVDEDVFGVNVQTELDLDSHHVAAGVGFHF
jgi:opacity protein-like surface antigen